MVRGEAIKASFLIYGHTVFALHCTGGKWKGFRAWNELHKCYE